MGLLKNGEWHDDWYEKDDDGSFVRPDTSFREWVKADGNTPFEPEAGRYHLYVSWACPWAHRALIARRLCGLEDAVSLTVVDPHMASNGWEITGDGIYADPIHGAKFLHQVYTAARADYTGRVTVPVLWDKKTGTIVNNESREILRMFDVEFADVGETGESLYFEDIGEKIDAAIDRIYQPINNGVYRAGFADTQEAYEKAVGELFAAFEYWDGVLGNQRYLCGERMTEADVCMFTTLVRFDPVYAYHFKCNKQRIDAYPNLFAFLRDIYQTPGVAETVNFDHIKQHYYWSHDTVNPKRIVPVGPQLMLDEPHGRG